MYQAPLPDHVQNLTDEQTHELITQARASLGKDVVILGHHYQRDEVIRHADHTGDSLKLAKVARDLRETKNIIFCGVHFMAETTNIMAAPHQRVSLPDMRAGCDMADMAQSKDVAKSWKEANDAGITSIVPVTYINSTAALKAFVGEQGGVVCTSGNAKTVIKWALERGEHLFFFPDQHLGRNISKVLGFDPAKDMVLWDPDKHLGGNTIEQLRSAKIWLWKGHCPVHAMFTVKQIYALRKDSPETKIIVHPECAMEVVDLADDIGSTEQIIDKVRKSPAGTAWAVGTEKHLVERMAAQFPDKKITSLNPYTCLCGTMNRISAKHLAWVLSDLRETGVLRNSIEVAPKVADLARLALQRMFDLS